MRYAIYFTPESGSDLNHLGAVWLGRDAYSGLTMDQPDPRLFNITASARRYGLHGTLKPPFHLKDGSRLSSLSLSVGRIATENEVFRTPPLVLADLDGFLALVPETSCADVNKVAAACVERLDDFRAPPSDSELRRRRAQGLTPTQEVLLQRWGYPFVFDEFRFHMTLTDRLSDSDRAWALPLAEAHFASVLGKPCLFDGLTISLEPQEGQEFRVVERFSLARSTRQAA